VKKQHKRAAIITGYDISTFKGGIESFIINLRDLLEKNIYEVDIHHSQPFPTLPCKRFPLRVSHQILPELLKNCFMFGRAFKRIEDRYDIIISNNFYGLGFFSPRIPSFNIYHSSHAAYADALKAKIPASDHRKLKYLYGYIGDTLSGRGKGKIAVSGQVSAELCTYYKFNKIHIVKHGIDTSFFQKIHNSDLRKKYRIPVNADVGIYVGRWEIGKGVDVVSKLMENTPGVFWVLVPGSTGCSLSERDNVRIVQNAGRETIRELFSLSDFMLLPSYYEGFGLVILEAMSCQLPVICTHVGIAHELYANEVLKSLIIRTMNKSEMIDTITLLMNKLKENRPFREEIIQEGRRVAEMEYSMEQWSENMTTALGLDH
jgi:glycosyltransferase involved in cell wall biosynthesis